MSLKDAPTVLIVDDEDRILASLQRTLRREGYRLLFAQSPREALRLLNDEPVDLVMSDPNSSELAVTSSWSTLRMATRPT